MRLKGKIALVTGAATGIGAATARRFAAEGAIVFVSDLNREKGEQVCAESKMSMTFVALDVSSETDWRKMKIRIADEYGRLDVMVNNAGVALPGDDIETGSMDIWNKTMGVNLTGVYMGCHYMMDLLKKSASASVVNVSSVVVYKPTMGVAYTASKAAVFGLTRSIAIHCAKHNYSIRCNSVHPGGVETDMVRDIINSAPDPKGLEKDLIDGHLIKRFAEPDEVVNGILYLASDESRFVTGIALAVDGGMSIA